MRTLPISVDAGGLEDFCCKWSVRELSLFGSILRDDFGSGSDVDVLVDFEDPKTLTLDSYVDMKDELSRLFAGRDIDLVEGRRLADPYRRHEILRTRKTIYAR